MDQLSSALLRLNLETRPYHEAADAGWLALLGDGITRDDYIHQLVTTYGFEAPLESALAYTPNLALFLEARRRARAGLLVADLLALDMPPLAISNLPLYFPLAPFSSPLEALGWIYVSERATLLHDRVRRHLLETVPDVRDACAYLSAYDKVTAARWSELGHVLERATHNERLMTEVIAGAHAGFRALIAWSHTAFARTAQTRLVARG